MTDRVRIRKLATGVRGLDDVLGGGLPEYSFNLIAGAPGCGKTTLAHQFLFANATETNKALYFTVVGEPPIKMLRYQQQFAFFDSSKIDRAIRFIHLGKDMLDGGLARVLERVKRELDDFEPRVVVVDSFRSLATPTMAGDGDRVSLERFVQTLALTLTSYEATTFLVGEYMEQEANVNPVFTVADGILWLYQNVRRNAAIRQMQIIKMRGQDFRAGLHTVRLDDKGLRVFPRMDTRVPRDDSSPKPTGRKKTGVPALDEMMGGGIPTGYSLLVTGPSGSGKTTLATQFVLAGAENDEPAVVVLFETRPADYLRGSSRRPEIDRLVKEKKLELVYLRPLDLSIDETVAEIQEAVTRVGAKRVVIDSISGLELALAPGLREDFREALYRTVSLLTSLDVTVVLTDGADPSPDTRSLSNGISFLADGIIVQRFVEGEGRINKVITVTKMRTSAHSSEVRPYEITEHGIAVASAKAESTSK